MTATSSSDRIEAARKALALIENEPNAAKFYADNARKMMRPEGFIDGNGEHYDSTALVHNIGAFGEMLAYAADALRGLIEPDAVNETTNDIAMRLWFGADADLIVATRGQHSRVIALLESAADAGIIAGWNSWEPENAPGTPPVVNRAEYNELCEVIDRVKVDAHSLSTDWYAGMVLDALGLQA